MEYLKNERQLERFCAEQLAGQPRLAVDTEFVGDSRYYPQLEIIQIATPEGAEAIVDYQEISGGGAQPERLAPLWDLFAAPEPELVFHAAKEDIKVLYFAMGRPLANVFDTQLAMSFLDRRAQIGYVNIVQELCGEQLDKGPQMLDWSRRPLTPDMLRYAINDVTRLLEIREKLLARLEQAKRLDWFLEEKASTHMTPLETEPREAWRRVKKSNSLRGKSLAVLVELAAWREEEAMSANIPTQRVLADDVLVAVARLKPQHARDLERATRRLTRDHIRRSGDDLLACVKRGLAAKDLPQLPESSGAPPSWAKGLASLLSAFAEARADSLKIASARLAKSKELDIIAQDPAAADKSGTVPALTGWRREAIGEELLALARGDRALLWEPRTHSLESVLVAEE